MRTITLLITASVLGAACTINMVPAEESPAPAPPPATVETPPEVDSATVQPVEGAQPPTNRRTRRPRPVIEAAPPTRRPRPSPRPAETATIAPKRIPVDPVVSDTMMRDSASLTPPIVAAPVGATVTRKRTPADTAGVYIPAPINRPPPDFRPPPAEIPAGVQRRRQPGAQRPPEPVRPGAAQPPTQEPPVSGPPPRETPPETPVANQPPPLQPPEIRPRPGLNPPGGPPVPQPPISSPRPVEPPVSSEPEAPEADSSAALKIPPGHYPAAGQCRIWFEGMPPGQQADPRDCDGVLEEAPAGSIVLVRTEEEPHWLEAHFIHADSPGVVVSVERIEIRNENRSRRRRGR